MKTTGPYSRKPYQCSECKHEFETGTNHWGEIYPYCNICRKITVCVCQEEPPEGYGIPAPWKMVTLGEIIETWSGEDRHE